MPVQLTTWRCHRCPGNGCCFRNQRRCGIGCECRADCWKRAAYAKVGGEWHARNEGPRVGQIQIREESANLTDICRQSIKRTFANVTWTTGRQSLCFTQVKRCFIQSSAILTMTRRSSLASMKTRSSSTCPTTKVSTHTLFGEHRGSRAH